MERGVVTTPVGYEWTLQTWRGYSARKEIGRRGKDSCSRGQEHLRTERSLSICGRTKSVPGLYALIDFISRSLLEAFA